MSDNRFIRHKKNVDYKKMLLYSGGSGSSARIQSLVSAQENEQQATISPLSEGHIWVMAKKVTTSYVYRKIKNQLTEAR